MFVLLYVLQMSHKKEKQKNPTHFLISSDLD